MACDQWQAQLDSYLDGELSAEAMRSLDAHLARLPACTADVLARVQFKRAIKMAGKRFAPSAEFRAKLQKAVAPQRRWNWNFGWKLATAALALALFAGAVTTYAGRESLRRQHFYTATRRLARGYPGQRQSGRRHLHRPAHGEALVPGKDSLQFQLA